MTLLDRSLRALFVALAVGLLWGIRGDFGHSLGAMAPGAALGLGFCYVAGYPDRLKMFRWMPLLGAAGALFISIGGRMSYGVLHGYAKSDTLVNYSYGFFTLVLEGGAWGGFGGAAIGLLLENRRLKLGEFASLLASVFLCGWLFYFFVVTLGGFHINPPRNDLSIDYTGKMIGLVAWLAWNRKYSGLRGCLLGFMGFGLGMALGRLAANASYLQPYAINHWNIMEVGCGFVGGLVFTFGMLGYRYPDPPEDEGWPLVSTLGAVFVMGFIPWLHRLRRIDVDEKMTQWQQTLTSYGVNDPEAASLLVLRVLDVVCVLGFVGAAVWLVAYRRGWARLAAFPVMYFSLLMIVFQNTNGLYFWHPPREQFINMHGVFWVIYAMMAVLVVAMELLLNRRAAPAERASDAPVRWHRYAAGSVTVYLLIVLVAGFVNGDKTMQSANTRFPVWSWSEGPPPDR